MNSQSQFAPQIVCILGMHRSGTSVVSRAVNSFGYYLGSEEHLMPATEFNPGGYWENRMFANLNDAILARFGGSWDEPPRLPPGWENSAQVADLHTYAANFIEREFKNYQAWSWKDPRTCLTLPFWQKVLPTMKYVIVLRHPLDVAASLQKRDGFSLEKGLRLWSLHVREVFVNTTIKDRVVVNFEDWLADPVSQAGRVYRFLMPSNAYVPECVQNELPQFVDRALVHHESSWDVAFASDALTEEAGRLYDFARSFVPHHDGSPRVNDTTCVFIPNSLNAKRETAIAFQSDEERLRSFETALNTQATLLVQADQARLAAESARNELAERLQAVENALRTGGHLFAASGVEADRYIKRIESLRQQMSRLQISVDQQSQFVRAVETSLAWRLVEKVRTLRNTCLPPNSFRRQIYDQVRDFIKAPSNPDSSQIEESANSVTQPSPKVSVIVPNYNHAPYLVRRIESILCQDFDDFEVILLDDGSTDASRDILRLYAADPRCRLFLSPINVGKVTEQWQRGLSHAHGEYIWFAESDDYACPLFLRRLARVLDENPSVGLVYCQSYQVGHDSVITGDNKNWTDDLDPKRWSGDFVNNGRDEVARYLSKKNTIPNASAVLLRARVVKSLGSVVSRYQLCGDWELWIKVLLKSDVAFMAEPLNFWRQHSSNVRKHPAGVLEFKEGVEIIKFVSAELAFSDIEIEQRLKDFSNLCHQWLQASKGYLHCES